MLVEAADAGAAADAVDVFDFDAGEEFEEFADVALGNIAEGIGGDGGGDVHVAALLHDGLGVTFALVGDDEGLELEGLVGGAFAGGGRGAGRQRAGDGDLADGGLARSDGEGVGRGRVTGVGDGERDGTGGDGGEGKRAVALGLGDEGGAGDAISALRHIAARRGIIDTAVDRAGGRLRSERGGEGGERRQHRPRDVARGARPRANSRQASERWWVVVGRRRRTVKAPDAEGQIAAERNDGGEGRGAAEVTTKRLVDVDRREGPARRGGMADEKLAG